MRKLFGYVLAVAIVAMPVVASAAEFRVGNQPSVRTDEQVANDVYMTGSTVTSSGHIMGDLVAGGGSVIVSGVITSDVIAGGGNVTILADVGDDVRAGGGNVVIEGKVGGDVIAGGGQITLGGPGVNGDVAIAGGVVHIDAPVAGSLRIGGGDVYINAPIKGDITIEAGTVTLGSAAVISGTLTYKANKELIKEEGAAVNGKVDFTARPVKTASPAALWAVFSAFVFGKFLALLVAALTVGLLFRRYSREIITSAVERPFLEIGRGLVMIAAMPVISVLLLVTLVGIPLGVLGLIGFAASLLFAWIVAPIIVGSVAMHYISKKDWDVSWKTILVGVFLYSLAGLVPVIGWLAQALLMLLTLGCMGAVKWSVLKAWR